MDLQMIFYIHIGEERMILHICEPTHGFFWLTKEKEKKWYCTFTSLQMVFSTHAWEE